MGVHVSGSICRWRFRQSVLPFLLSPQETQLFLQMCDRERMLGENVWGEGKLFWD